MKEPENEQELIEFLNHLFNHGQAVNLSTMPIMMGIAGSSRETFEEMLAKLRELPSIVDVGSVRSIPVYCGVHDEHRDGVFVSVMGGEWLEAARRAVKNPSLKVIGLTTYDGEDGEADTVLLDVETAKQLVNRLVAAIAMAEEQG